MKSIQLKATIKLLFISIFGFFSCQNLTKEDDNNLTKFVDPFIGSGGHGHVFVGANVPFGGVQLGPSNFYKGWDWSSSYHYTDSIVKGLTHLNLSGTGVTDLGELILMPTTGKRKTWSGATQTKFLGHVKKSWYKTHGDKKPEEAYASFYRKETEVAKPGYYSVQLDDYDIKVELTASERVGMHRYTFPESDEARIIIDLSEGNSDTSVETYLHQINETTFEGYRFSKGWASDQREYFTLVSSKPISDFILYEENQKLDGDQAKGVYTKGILEFKTEKYEVIKLKMGISPVSSKNALENIESEIPHWDFDLIADNADRKWNKELSKVKITTTDLTKKRIFYTAMFHTMIAPNIFNDVNGEYRGTDKKVYADPGFTNYTLFSLWDTYRAAHPLYTITQPERVSDMINSMLLIYEQQGKLPVWHLRGNETNTMPGYSAIPVVVDACLKGFEGIDLEKAYEAVKTTATGDFEPGVKDLMKYGYIPADHGAESVASAMEYAISDWGIAKLAEKLGKKEDAAYFEKRAKGYEEYFDQETRFMRGKLSDGSWRTPFDPVSALHRINDYCEGNAWQYLWMVPQDPEGLISLLGGDLPFVEKLDELFSRSSDLGEGASLDITGMIGQYAHGNEPSHHTAYLYAYAGEQYKIADKVDYIMNELYRDQPDGLSGNEDCGQMSAWYVLSSIGFYSVNPSNGAYVFGRPLFDSAVIELPMGKKFIVEAKNNGDENIYIQSVTLNGEPYSKSFITHKNIVEGGTLRFLMGPKPNKKFAADQSDRPKSVVY
ncbi:MAG: GH92 family glycosyl hydrolase [Bacteroidetes bacterium]|nr:GH92 family glycosyl hydrolase [Bacteroidota bacterium]MDA1085048.1 GH92 family glycosyl hydrolase [Bacteroidota bacterium]